MLKKLNILAVLLAGLLLMAGPAIAWRGTPGPAQTTPATPQQSSTYYAPLSQEEIDGLQYMVEEEKLARDVYLYLYEKWGLQIFKNIADSEQNHMDAVSALLDKYGIENPAADEPIGVFQNEKIQELYNQLIEMGSQSPEAALKVGALIEETDIEDLEKWISETDNEDIKQVYSNLMAGSENHLRAFVSQLEAMGVTYTAQVLPQEQVDEILSSAPAHGMGGMGSGAMNTQKTDGGQDTGFMGHIYRFMNAFRNAFQKMYRLVPI